MEAGESGRALIGEAAQEEELLRVLGPAGTKGLSKVTALVLAVIAVMMIRVGLQSVLASPQ